MEAGEELARGLSRKTESMRHAWIERHALQDVSHGCGCLALRKSFTIGTMTGMRCISVTCVVAGRMANRDEGSGLMSPWISPPF